MVTPLITALDTGLLRIKLNENGLIILCGGLAEMIEIE
jgi:F0F1-type ATP synthase epsilon subunit